MTMHPKTKKKFEQTNDAFKKFVEMRQYVLNYLIETSAEDPALLKHVEQAFRSSTKDPQEQEQLIEGLHWYIGIEEEEEE